MKPGIFSAAHKNRKMITFTVIGYLVNILIMIKVVCYDYQFIKPDITFILVFSQNNPLIFDLNIK
jgi:hypothetical protein